MRPVVGVMIIFWLTFIGFSWFVAKLYLPFMTEIFGGIHASTVAVVLVWLIVVSLLTMILVLFRNLLHGIFYGELAKLEAKKKSSSSKTRLDR